MYNKAHEIGLPAALVELRHEATHGDIPSLKVLRSAAQRSLQWLFIDYWQRLPQKVSYEEPASLKDKAGELDQRLMSILKKHNNRAIRAYTDDPHQYHSSCRHWTDKTSLRLREICQEHYVATTEIARALIKGRFLVPNEKESVPGNSALFLFLIG